MMPLASNIAVQEEWDETRPRLRPRVHPLIRDALAQKDFILDLVERHGSPLNLVFPQNLEGNISDFQSVFKKERLRGRIYYVTKPCKSFALMRAARKYDVGVDVSSVNSLNAVLKAGWAPDRVVANGPKNTEYLSLCVQNGIHINADSFDELEQLSELYAGAPINLGVRLCGFHSPRAGFTEHDSTFGIHIKHLERVLDILNTNKDVFAFKGFSFHIPTTQDDLRLVAIENILSATFRAIKSGLRPRSVNIGGGFPIRYAENAAEWDGYTSALKKSVLGEIPAQTWNKSGLGYRSEKGLLSGGPMFVDHLPARAKGEMLDFLLNSPLPEFGGQTAAALMRDSLLELHIEPGKAMFDQCGVTLGKVLFVKESSWGETLAGLDMNHTNILSAGQKLLTEPLILYRDDTKNAPCGEGLYYMGNLCLTYDIIQYNKTYPQKTPRRGDVVAFMNTAAYLMDFAESETLMQPVARKIALIKDEKNWFAVEDEKYEEGE